MLTIMKTTVVTLIIIAFFTSPETNLDYSNLEHVVGTEPKIILQLDSIDEEFEEYPVEDYVEDTYVDTECQDCLRSVETDSCMEVHSDCLDLPDCADWLACVGWCEAYEGEDDCYNQCDEHFIDNEMVEIDFRICACETCGMECRTLCGVEGY